MAFLGDNGCEIWCRWDGTGTVAIEDSFNVSSVTDNGTGDYTVNFSVTMSGAQGNCVVSAQGGMIFNANDDYSTTTTQRCISLHRDNSYQQLDVNMFCIAIFGDRSY
mgnify:FL=1|tara:strand:- start:301 stop:621 length:321 start_codon:yes stop_codon:yes gene_type:complete